MSKFIKGMELCRHFFNDCAKPIIENIKVIFAEKFAEAAKQSLKGTAFEKSPPIGALSQIGGVASIMDENKYYEQIIGLYKI